MDTPPFAGGDPVAELSAALERSVLADVSTLSRLLATGPDFLALLQRLSTGDVAGLLAGQGKPTILTTPKGRIAERLFVHHLGQQGVLAVAGRDAGPRVLAHMLRYTFAERTGLEDVTGRTFQCALVGPHAAEALERAGLAQPEPCAVVESDLAGARVWVLGQDGVSPAGFSVMGDAAARAGVWDALAQAVLACGGMPAGELALEARRVLLGLPAPGHELTEEHNPLEAGQWDAVSFAKGCYVGQEVVARLRTYDKIASTLVRLELEAGAPLPAPGSRLLDGERAVGRVTSAIAPPGRAQAVALGYVKRKALREGLVLSVAPSGARARVVEQPARGDGP